MRKVVVWMSVSLDGFIEGPGHDLSWHRVDEELHQHFNDELSAMGGFVSGRTTYELMAGFWPTADQDPANAGPMAEFAGIWRDMPKTVYSRTLDSAGWNTTIVRGIDVPAVDALKAEPGGDLALSGAEVAAQFRQLGLVDEYRLYVHPVLVGQGTPLFAPGAPPGDLTLVGIRTFGNGVVLLSYACG